MKAHHLTDMPRGDGTWRDLENPGIDFAPAPSPRPQAPRGSRPALFAAPRSIWWTIPSRGYPTIRGNNGAPSLRRAATGNAPGHPPERRVLPWCDPRAPRGARGAGKETG